MKVVGLVLLFVLICALAAAGVMMLWNALMPTIFGLPLIGFWQAAGLLVLCQTLFGTGLSYKGCK